MKILTLVFLVSAAVVACSGSGSAIVDNIQPPAPEVQQSSPVPPVPTTTNPTPTSSSTSTVDPPPPPVPDSGTPDSSVALDSSTDSSTPDAADADASNPPTCTATCCGTVTDAQFNITNVPWTYTVKDDQVCASAGAQSDCRACVLVLTDDTPQCSLVFAGPTGRGWKFMYNPVTKILDIKTTGIPGSSWTPSCP